MQDCPTGLATVPEGSMAGFQRIAAVMERERLAQRRMSFLCLALKAELTYL
jgi:hypothetical protein